MESRGFSFHDRNGDGKVLIGYFKYPVENWVDYLKLCKVRFNSDYTKKRVGLERKLDDFERLNTLGTGAFGRVILVKLIGQEEYYYAIKVLDKERIVKTKQIDHTLGEKRILQSIKFPFTVSMEFFFMDNSYLYFGMPFIQGGEMFNHLRNQGKFSEPLSRFYAAQVILALEFLHFLELVYRDLKPENILVDKDGYIKITDMGFCKQIKGRTYTLCGTPEYLAPEVIMNKGYGFSPDWWSLGILIYEMSAGYPPFYSHEPIQIYEKIVAGKYSMPKSFSEDLRDLVKNIIQIDFTRRFGCMKGGVNDIKDHVFFQGIKWMDILNKKVEAPFRPRVKGIADVSNFDKLEDTLLNISSRDKYNKEFAEF